MPDDILAHDCEGCGADCDCLFKDNHCHGCWACHSDTAGDEEIQMCADCHHLVSCWDSCSVCYAPMCSGCFEMGAGVCRGPHKAEARR